MIVVFNLSLEFTCSARFSLVSASEIEQATKPGIVALRAWSVEIYRLRMR